MQRLDTAKREAILDAAKQRLRQYGIKKTTMQEIAEDAGIAVGTLYLYFKNKEEIFLAVVEDFNQKHLENAEQILGSSLPPVEKLKQYILNRFRDSQASLRSGSHAAELTRAVLRRKPELIAQQQRRVRETVRSILLEGIELQQFAISTDRDAEEIVQVDRDLEVFLYAIGYFFPMPTTEQYYEPEEEKLCLMLDWFIQKWSPLSA